MGAVFDTPPLFGFAGDSIKQLLSNLDRDEGVGGSVSDHGGDVNLPGGVDGGDFAQAVAATELHGGLEQGEHEVGSRSKKAVGLTAADVLKPGEGRHDHQGVPWGFGGSLNGDGSALGDAPEAAGKRWVVEAGGRGGFDPVREGPFVQAIAGDGIPTLAMSGEVDEQAAEPSGAEAFGDGQVVFLAAFAAMEQHEGGVDLAKRWKGAFEVGELLSDELTARSRGGQGIGFAQQDGGGVFISGDAGDFEGADDESVLTGGIENRLVIVLEGASRGMDDFAGRPPDQAEGCQGNQGEQDAEDEGQAAGISFHAGWGEWLYGLRSEGCNCKWQGTWWEGGSQSSCISVKMGLW
jgi:hypothetical protein